MGTTPSFGPLGHGLLVNVQKFPVVDVGREALLVALALVVHVGEAAALAQALAQAGGRRKLGLLLHARHPQALAQAQFAGYYVAEAQGFEGVLAKRAESVYEPGRRSRNWLKVKTHGRQELVIAGFTHGKGRRSAGIGALVLPARGGRVAFAVSARRRR